MVKQLTLTEIRTLIRGHNKMSQIKVPSGLDRDGLIKFLKSRKYKVDHVKKILQNLNLRLMHRNRKHLIQKRRKMKQRRKNLN